MKLSCPVFCSNTSSMVEIAQNNAFLFDPYKPESFLNVFNKNANNENLVNKKIAAKLYSKKFSWEQCAIETNNIYKTIL